MVITEPPQIEVGFDSSFSTQDESRIATSIAWLIARYGRAEVLAAISKVAQIISGDGIRFGEACRKYQIAGNNLRKWIEDGLIRVLKRFTPKLIYISDSDIQRHLNGKVRKSSAPIQFIDSEDTSNSPEVSPSRLQTNHFRSHTVDHSLELETKIVRLMIKHGCKSILAVAKQVAEDISEDTIRHVDACKLYGILDGTLSLWIQKGIVRILKRVGSNLLYISKSDVVKKLRLCVICELRKDVHKSRGTGKLICEICANRQRGRTSELCADCGEKRPVAMRLPGDRARCHKCYRRITGKSKSKVGICPSCHEGPQLISYRHPNRRIKGNICRDCHYGTPLTE